MGEALRGVQRSDCIDIGHAEGAGHGDDQARQGDHLSDTRRDPVRDRAASHCRSRPHAHHRAAARRLSMSVARLFLPPFPKKVT